MIKGSDLIYRSTTTLHMTRSSVVAHARYNCLNSRYFNALGISMHEERKCLPCLRCRYKEKMVCLVGCEALFSLPDWCHPTVAMQRLVCVDLAKNPCHSSLLPLTIVNKLTIEDDAGLTLQAPRTFRLCGLWLSLRFEHRCP